MQSRWIVSHAGFSEYLAAPWHDVGLDTSSILTALNAVPAGATQGLTRARTAIYLITSSSQYQVEY